MSPAKTGLVSSQSLARALLEHVVVVVVVVVVVFSFFFFAVCQAECLNFLTSLIVSQRVPWCLCLFVLSGRGVFVLGADLVWM